jgi:hypothetical protein
MEPDPESTVQKSQFIAARSARSNAAGTKRNEERRIGECPVEAETLRNGDKPGYGNIFRPHPLAFSARPIINNRTGA